MLVPLVEVVGAMSCGARRPSRCGEAPAARLLDLRPLADALDHRRWGLARGPWEAREGRRTRSQGRGVEGRPRTDPFPSPPSFLFLCLYLRVTQDDARSPEKIRSASRESLRDAFTSCLLHTPHLTQHKGQACRVSKECPAGQLCNEADVCSTPAQPFNLRLAYHGLRVLSDAWVRNVQSSGDSASDTLVLRRYEMDIDSATSNDLPVVTELLRKAEFFLVVVDEVPEGFKPPTTGSVGQASQSEPHPARIALYDLKSSELLLRLHRTVDATILAIPSDAETIDAQRRQILNCALAQEVRAALNK